jgi:hypothetical protein
MRFDCPAGSDGLILTVRVGAGSVVLRLRQLVYREKHSDAVISCPSATEIAAPLRFSR